MAKAAFQAPGMTLAEVEAAVAAVLGWNASDSTTLAKIDQAITAVGQAAATWNGRNWWWLRALDTFPTVASTKSYALRTVDTAAMADLYAVQGMWLDADRRLVQISKEAYDEWNTTQTSTGAPIWYALSGDLTAYLWPTPSAVHTVTVAYIRRHSKITNAGSTDAALIVPAEFHYPVYVDGAAWLLKNETASPQALSQSPRWAEAMRQMAMADAEHFYDTNTMERGGESYPSYPPDIRVYPNVSTVSI